LQSRRGTATSLWGARPEIIEPDAKFLATHVALSQRPKKIFLQHAMTFNTMGNSGRVITKTRKHERGNPFYEHEHAKFAKQARFCPIFANLAISCSICLSEQCLLESCWDTPTRFGWRLSKSSSETHIWPRRLLGYSHIDFNFCCATTPKAKGNTEARRARSFVPLPLRGLCASVFQNLPASVNSAR